jgi:hypothetical protein
MTISINDPAVKEVMNLRDDKGIQKTKLDIGGEGREEVSDGGFKQVVDVTKGNVVGGRREAGTDTENKGGDVKESSLKLVGGGDEQSMVGASLKHNDSRKSQGCAEEFILGNKI